MITEATAIGGASDGFDTSKVPCDESAREQDRARSPEALSGPTDSHQVVTVRIDSLQPADSPRLDGENLAHTRMLAEAGDVLPPILVHRQTMQVIDGMHRLRAAKLRGAEEIEVTFFEGTGDMAFVLAVVANVKHGLPLSLADRQAAARRILGSNPQWSDRRIGASTGLSAKTIAAIRRATEDSPQLNGRVGRDGRVRPLDSADRRRRAVEVINSRPDTSLRQVAEAAGVSVGTVRDIRERMRRGEDPVSRNRHRRALLEELGTAVSASPGPANVEGLGSRQSSPRDQVAILADLKRDPSLRYTEQGRDILRWLDA
ncbi:MAG: ParB N-terminal domain-containing protein, partial [Mycobacterium sp.]|nr:ParB N-terminal domain-containing protein [Mycobacterium sp.]